MPELVIVGGGPAGVAAALAGARQGADVTVIESSNVGGTCVHAGCIPAGAYHRTVALRDEVSRAAALGLLVGAPALDWERMQSWVSSLVNAVFTLTRTSLASAGVEVISSHARFSGRGGLQAGGKTFDGVPVILATGALSVAPDVPGKPAIPILTNDGAMALSGCPASLVVMGAGRFSIEWADFFASLGSRVTIITPGARILPGEDAEIAGFLQLVLEQRGVGFLLGAGIDEVAGSTVVVAAKRVAADAILSADTRIPNTKDLGLNAAGVAVAEHGGIAADAGCRTSIEAVFAAGDVTGPPWLSNRARAQGMAAATNALGGSVKMRPERLPRSVNTHPELAAVGLTEEQAAARGIKAAVGFGEMAASPRALTLGEARGALKLVVDPEFGEILGAHMVGVGAVEVIAQVAAAIELEADYRDLARIHHLHPSLAELVTEAVSSI